MTDPVWVPYDVGGSYPGRRWVADGLVVDVTACAEWHVTPTDRGRATGIHGDSWSVAEAERCALLARGHVLAIERFLAGSDLKRRWHRQLSTVMREVLAKFPAAVDHLPGEPITPCFIPGALVDPRFHFVVPDFNLEHWNKTMHGCAHERIAEFKDWASSDLSNYTGPDAVLVIAPVQ